MSHSSDAVESVDLFSQVRMVFQALICANYIQGANFPQFLSYLVEMPLL